MRVNIVTGPFLPVGGGPSGAVEKRWFGVGLALADEKHDVMFNACTWAGQAADEIVRGARIRRFKGYSRSQGALLNLAKDFVYSMRVWRSLTPADVTVTNAFWLPVVMSIFRRNSGAIVVNVARFPKHQFWLYSWVDRLSAVSLSVADAILQQAPHLCERVRVIPNPIDLSCFKPRKPLPPIVQSYRVLYSGRVHPEKGLHILISAIRRLLPDFPGIALTILGPTRTAQGGGGDSYLAKLKNITGDLNVVFEPSIDDPEALAARMADADYYCYPSLADKGESFGVAPLEAMALGFAPIVSNLACFREYVKDGENAYVFDHRGSNPVASLADTLARAMRNPEKTRDMGLSAIATAGGFGYETIAQAYERDWLTILNR